MVALALQLAALVALSLSLLGFSWLDARSRPRVLVLVDRSQSVPRAASDTAVADVMRGAKAAGSGELQLLEFAGRPAAPAAKAADSVADLEPSATNIEAALEAALAADARTPFASVVLISDGLENVGDLERALRAARDARLPVQWIPAGRPLPETRISEVLAPDRAIAGRRIQITVQLAGRLDRPLRVRGNRALHRRRDAGSEWRGGCRRSGDDRARRQPQWRRSRGRGAGGPGLGTNARYAAGRRRRRRGRPRQRSCMRRVRPVFSRAACAKAAGC